MQKITFSEQAGNNWKRNALRFEPEEVNGDREAPVTVEAEPIEVPLSLSRNCG